MSFESRSLAKGIEHESAFKQSSSLLAVVNQLADVLLIWGLLAAIVSVSNFAWDASLQAPAFAASLLYYVIAYKHGLYFSWRGRSLLKEAQEIFTSWITVVALLLTAAFFTDELPTQSHPTELFVVWVIAVPVAISFHRVSTRIVLRELRRAGVNTRKVAIVGAKEPGISLAAQVSASPWMGLEVVGFFDDEVPEGLYPIPEEDFRVIGDIGSLRQAARGGEFDDIYIALPMREEEVIRSLIEELANSSCCVHIVPDVFTFKMLNAKSKEIGGLPVISIYDTPFDSFDAFLKRVEDVVLSSIILSIIAIPMLFLAVTVKLSSPGPAIFKQRRYGINGEKIEVWKFRSMTCCDNGDSIKQATKNDARITKIGALLRKTSLDELPQFINVLQGTMSIVGPRPHAVAHNELYRDQIAGYMQRHLVKPGITGWAQVNGWRGETDTLEKMEKRVEFDLTYIKHWSLLFDLKIVFLTLWKGFVSSRAY